MFSSLLSLTLLGVLLAQAKPVTRDQSPISIPLTRKLNLTQGATLTELDRARFSSFGSSARSKKRSAGSSLFDVSATNGAVEYTVTIGIGSPATDYTLIVDTGSSNTWIGADQAYVQTSTSEATGDLVEVEYGSGAFIGEEYLDDVTLATGYTITQQSIGVAFLAQGFDGVDGILGIGPEDLTEGTVEGVDEVATVTQNLYSQGLISVEEVGISFEPTTSESDTNGILTFGGTDSSRYTGDIAYVAITSTTPAGDYVGIDQSITYGDAGTSILDTTAGIVDTGTTLVYLPTSAYDAYTSATGATLDETTGLLTISSTDYDNLESLYFDIGGTTYEFTANAQTWPRALNTYIGGSSDSIYLIISDFGDSAENGFEFINGYTWLERFYFVYDSGSNEVGFATTSYTSATTN